MTNTLTGQKEPFEPLNPPQVKMYVCGPTVYGDIHIGNARSQVNFDVIRKYLVYAGYQVTYVVNITDIDDKIIKISIEEKRDAKEVAETYTKAYFEVMDKLGVQKADIHPKATEYIPEMIALVTGLIEKGKAYVVPSTDLGKDVNFDSTTFKTYGKLSGKNLEELQEGARVEKNETKRNPTDFVLWKASKPGEPQWDSPWGKGRPGWHIECSSMVRKLLGDSIDVHGGGIDLIFPHHENEIAQCEAFTEKPYVKYWLHNGFIEIAGQKMSKSLGNIWKAKDALRDFRPEVLRYFFLSAHYRSGLNYDRPILEAAARGWDEFNQTFQRIEDALGAPDSTAQTMDLLELRLAIDEVETKFKEAMDDDFNTPKALAALFDLARETRRVLSQSARMTVGAKSLLGEAAEKLNQLGGLLGIVSTEKVVVPLEVVELAQKRLDLKQEKKFKEADEVRAQVLAKGYVIEDVKGGTFRILPKK
ncbi:MAG TPA: cysteine--tRNA ligase [bacterium]|nr:cysteine--tRNA ligase [bacterium]